MRQPSRLAVLLTCLLCGEPLSLDQRRELVLEVLRLIRRLRESASAGHAAGAVGTADSRSSAPRHESRAAPAGAGVRFARIRPSSPDPTERT